MKTDKVLVTGATGLLGANIVKELNNRGYKVKILTRPASKLNGLEGCNYEIIKGDITNKTGLEEAIQDCHYVIHAAAKTAQGSNRMKQYMKVNLEATQNLLKLSEKHHIKRFVYVSTANCFTNGTLNNPGNEEKGFMPWLKHSSYAYSKFLAQQSVLQMAKNKGPDALVVAPTFLIGPRDSKPSSGKLLLYALRNKIVFYPPGGKSFTDVEFAAQAIVNALTMGKNGESYLIAGKNMTYKDFFEAVSRVTGEKRILIPLPRTIINILANTLEITGKIFGFSPQLNKANAKLLTLDNYFSNKKAAEELKLKETDIEEAIKKAADWFEQHNMI